MSSRTSWPTRAATQITDSNGGHVPTARPIGVQKVSGSPSRFGSLPAQRLSKQGSEDVPRHSQCDKVKQN
eukprot:4667866-Pyramimonas_sp.AAC.1